MPTIAHIDREAHDRSLRTLAQLLQALHVKGDRFVESRKQMHAIEAEREQERQHHPEYASPSHRQRMEYWTVLIGTPAVLLLDFVVLNSMAEYLSGNLFPGYPKMLLLARIAVPLCIFWIELVLAHHFYSTYHSDNDRFSPKAACWVLMGVALAACVALSVVSSMLAMQAVDGDTGGPGGLAYGLGFLAFVIHISIVLGGGTLHQAKGYLGFRWRDGSLTKRLRNFEALHTKARRETARTFLAYLRELNLPATSLGEPAKAGPFSGAVRMSVNEIFGAGTIPGPAPTAKDPRHAPSDGSLVAHQSIAQTQPLTNGDESTRPEGSQLSTSGPHDQVPSDDSRSSTDRELAGENQYMRQILERVRLQQDEEVRL